MISFCASVATCLGLLSRKRAWKPMSTNKPYQENRIESENSTTNNDDKSRCLVCGEQRFERYKITLRQPLHGNGYGRIIETGSVCERCAPKLRTNARTEGDQ